MNGVINHHPSFFPSCPWKLDPSRTRVLGTFTVDPRAPIKVVSRGAQWSLRPNWGVPRGWQTGW